MHILEEVTSPNEHTKEEGRKLIKPTCVLTQQGSGCTRKLDQQEKLPTNQKAKKRV